MLRRLVFGTCIILMVASLIGCAPKPTPTPTPVVVPTPEATPVIQIVVTADGTLVSMRPALGLGFQVSGRVVEVLVRPGESVKAGQVIARLDTLNLENAVRDAKARLEQSRFELDRARRSAEAGTDLAAASSGLQAAWLGVINARGTFSSTLLRSDVSTDVRLAKFWADYWAGELEGAWLRLQENPQSDARRQRYEELGARTEQERNRMLQIQQDADNAISAARRSMATAQQSYLTALSNYNSIKNGDPVRQAELQVMLNETALTRAQMDLANAELKAPWDAMVATVDIAPGSQAGVSPVVTLVDIGSLQFLTTNLSERDLGGIAIGQKANVTLKTFPDARFTGQVSSISPLAGPAVGDAATFTVRIDLDPTELVLRPGMTGQVQIIVR